LNDHAEGPSHRTEKEHKEEPEVATANAVVEHHTVAKSMIDERYLLIETTHAVVALVAV
jgi:hypothetical protein